MSEQVEQDLQTMQRLYSVTKLLHRGLFIYYVITKGEEGATYNIMQIKVRVLT